MGGLDERSFVAPLCLVPNWWVDWAVRWKKVARGEQNLLQRYQQKVGKAMTGMTRLTERKVGGPNTSQTVKASRYPPKRDHTRESSLRLPTNEFGNANVIYVVSVTPRSVAWVGYGTPSGDNCAWSQTE
jgi:hypothetical protein